MFKNNVREFRERIGMAQIELARLACLTSSNLSAIEHGHREAWPIARRRLARALKCRENELFPEQKTQDAR